MALSPCIKLCELDNDDVCTGCKRTLPEIKEWKTANNRRRIEILKRIDGMKKHYLHGHPVYIIPPLVQAKEKLSNKVKVSRKFRSEMNEWLLQLFGVTHTERLKDGEVILTDKPEFSPYQKTIVTSQHRSETYLQMNESTLNILKEKHKANYAFR